MSTTPNRSAALGPKGGPRPLLPADVQYIAVHCSATGPTANIGRADIDRWHRLKGWAGVGYHWVIRRDGALEAGRDMTLRGAHVEDFNHCSIGICLAGGVDPANKPSANFTGAQLATLKTLLDTLQKQFPKAIVQGHRDFPNVAKACPSFDVRHWLKTGTIKP